MSITNMFSEKFQKLKATANNFSKNLSDIQQQLNGISKKQNDLQGRHHEISKQPLNHDDTFKRIEKMINTIAERYTKKNEATFKRLVTASTQNEADLLKTFKLLTRDDNERPDFLIWALKAPLLENLKTLSESFSHDGISQDERNNTLEEINNELSILEKEEQEITKIINSSGNLHVSHEYKEIETNNK